VTVTARWDGQHPPADRHADQQEPLWASDEVARKLDDLQFSLGEGPCVEAFVDRRPVLVADLTEHAHSRWPVFATAALRTPVRALFVLPVQAGAVTVGVLDLYRDTPGMLAPDELTGALRAADAAMWPLLGMLDGGTGYGGVDGHPAPEGKMGTRGPNCTALRCTRRRA
jgi:GAF domain-containing protein